MKWELGFTIIELLITMAVVLLLGAASVPAYLNYTRRDYFNTAIIPAASPFKKGIVNCYQHTANLNQCNGGDKYVPPDVSVPHGGVASIKTKQGVITIVPVEKKGIKSSDTLILTPKVVNGTLEWVVSGGAVADKYVN